MYHGQVNVAQAELNTFLSVAEELSVKGLTVDGAAPASSSKRPSAVKRAPAPAAPTPAKRTRRPSAEPGVQPPSASVKTEGRGETPVLMDDPEEGGAEFEVEGDDYAAGAEGDDSYDAYGDDDGHGEKGKGRHS